ncbi:MAG: hypothetical protein NTY36_17505 [Deltaproteobacteria bacterium]|nr:hypothetical protein [Deltaproteobacteria bacterium]
MRYHKIPPPEREAKIADTLPNLPLISIPGKIAATIALTAGAPAEGNLMNSGFAGSFGQILSG